MKLEQNDKAMLFSVTNIPDIFFTEYLGNISGDYVKIYLYLVFSIGYSSTGTVISQLEWPIHNIFISIFLSNI